MQQAVCQLSALKPIPSLGAELVYEEEPEDFGTQWEELSLAPPKMEDDQLQAKDPLIEVNLNTEDDPKTTFISGLLEGSFKEEIIALLKEYKDCFAWDYKDMPGLSRSLVEHRLPIKSDHRPYQQPPRRMSKEVELKVKEEIERLLRVGFIRPAKYTEWLANIVPVVKKNGTIRVCIDFRDLNAATPKDIYVMPVSDMLIDATANHEILTFWDCFAGYNQIRIAENDIHKTAFRCPGAIGTFEWVMMPFGLKNVGATY